MRAIYYLLGLCGLLALAFAFADAQTTAPTSAQDVLAKMAARNAGLDSYSVRVHVNMRLLQFPFYSPKLDGTTYYKRPGKSEVVFDSMPSYAKGVQKLFNDVADPAGWQKDSNIALQGMGQLDGRPMIVLILTKKIHSDQIDHTTVYVDPGNYELMQMDWHYTNGGTIVMKQYYRMQDGFMLVSQQHVDINYRFHAAGDSSYEPYKTNVPVADSVFAQ
jgi:outer membrane lipoprotein-sorting protein